MCTNEHTHTYRFNGSLFFKPYRFTGLNCKNEKHKTNKNIKLLCTLHCVNPIRLRDEYGNNKFIMRVHMRNEILQHCLVVESFRFCISCTAQYLVKHLTGSIARH